MEYQWKIYAKKWTGIKTKFCRIQRLENFECTLE